VRPPRIAESPVAMECERMATIDLAADRTLVMGRVLAMHIRDDAVLDRARCYVDTPRLGLVGRLHGAGWYARTDDRFEQPRIKPEDWVMKE
jgi:flavin reductase (DIM6/NTAB) family NADH-FMN oxidoreductase RutF